MKRASEMKGQCHCGAVKITLAATPQEIIQCNCSLCRKTGWTGAFWNPEGVVVDAQPDELNSYVQGDKMITLWNCRVCGSHTHWTPITAPPDRMGINIKMFDPQQWQHLPVRAVDGASF